MKKFEMYHAIYAVAMLSVQTKVICKIINFLLITIVMIFDKMTDERMNKNKFVMISKII